MDLDDLIKKADSDAKAKSSKEELMAEIAEKTAQSKRLDKELDELTVNRKRQIDKVIIDEISHLLAAKGFQFSEDNSKYVYSYKDVLLFEVIISDTNRTFTLIQGGEKNKIRKFDYLFSYKVMKESPSVVVQPNQDSLVKQIEDLQKDIEFLEYAIKAINSISYKIKLESEGKGYYLCDNAEKVIEMLINK
ncbi:MAG: hypothetical protein M0P01_09265 [Treponema sp.]|nr:hypothetical protein [Treponema sp.]